MHTLNNQNTQCHWCCTLEWIWTDWPRILNHNHTQFLFSYPKLTINITHCTIMLITTSTILVTGLVFLIFGETDLVCWIIITQNFLSPIPNWQYYYVNNYVHHFSNTPCLSHIKMLLQRKIHTHSEDELASTSQKFVSGNHMMYTK